MQTNRNHHLDRLNHAPDKSDTALLLIDVINDLEFDRGESLGIEDKLALWRALKAVADLSPDLERSDYERLMKRAIEQRSRAEALRLNAAIAAIRPKD